MALNYCGLPVSVRRYCQSAFYVSSCAALYPRSAHCTVLGSSSAIKDSIALLVRRWTVLRVRRICACKGVLSGSPMSVPASQSRTISGPGYEICQRRLATWLTLLLSISLNELDTCFGPFRSFRLYVSLTLERRCGPIHQLATASQKRQRRVM